MFAAVREGNDWAILRVVNTESIWVGLDLALDQAFKVKARGRKGTGFMELSSLNDPQIPNLQNASSYTAQVFTELNQS